VLYVGSPDSVEQRLASRDGIAYVAIETGQLRGRAPWTAARNLWRMYRGVGQSAQIFDRFSADVVLVTGGYVCVPVVIAARRQSCPVLIYLPDVTPGMAVRLLARLARQVAVSCPEAAAFFPGKAVVTGYPVRPALLKAADQPGPARSAFDLDLKEKTLLVFGGSRGARSINLALTRSLETLLAHCQIIHITGTLDWSWVQEKRNRLSAALRKRYRAFAYLHEKMPQALGAADLVLSRSGAATIGEYPAMGLPSLLVPYPHAGRHQEANARYLASRGAARVIDDAALGDGLTEAVVALLSDEQKLTSMRERALALAQPGAASRIVAALETLARRHSDQGTDWGGVRCTS
jgi:UDP-N-acetylglucosamine--N-acetylmuramyl-(pentapeptide) pyrophosphoryl-undecaprenol N-acetylglucosamine transferase